MFAESFGITLSVSGLGAFAPKPAFQILGLPLLEPSQGYFVEDLVGEDRLESVMVRAGHEPLQLLDFLLDPAPGGKTDARVDELEQRVADQEEKQERFVRQEPEQSADARGQDQGSQDSL